QVDDLLWSPDGKNLASYRDHDKTLNVWDTGTGREVLAFDFAPTFRGQPTPTMRRLPKETSWAWSADGTRLALGLIDPQPQGQQAVVQIWDITRCQMAGMLALGEPPRPWEASEALAWSPDGNWLAAGLRFWDVSTGKLAGEIPVDPKGTHPSPSLSWSPDG